MATVFASEYLFFSWGPILKAVRRILGFMTKLGIYFVPLLGFFRYSSQINLLISNLMTRFMPKNRILYEFNLKFFLTEFAKTRVGERGRRQIGVL